MAQISIEVAEKVVNIISSEENITILKKEMKDFLTSEKSDYEIYIEQIHNSKEQSVILQDFELEEIKTKENKAFVRTSYLDGDIHKKKAFFTTKIVKGSTTFKKQYIHLCIRNALRNCYILWFMDEMVAFHGAGIEKNEKGYLFCGPAGEGKTTIAKMSGKSLNDEFIFVKREKNGVYMYGTPFGGDMKSLNKKVLLKKIFFIKKSNHTNTTPLSETDKFIQALENNFLFFKIRAKEENYLMKKIFSKTKEVINKLPAYKLEFNLKEDFWRDIS